MNKLLIRNMKTAIVYDWIDKWGGVERVLLTLHELYPEANFFTSYYDVEKAGWAKDLKINTSFIQKLPSFIKKSRLLSLSLYPIAFESFNFSEYDLVISVTSAFAKGVITKPQTKHICYLLTPPRYLWGQSEMYMKNPILSVGSALLGNKLRNWDYIAAQRPDKIIAISNLVSSRSKKYYQRNVGVIYPPFDVEYWDKVKASIDEQDRFSYKKPFYLLVSRLESYKKIDIAIEAFNNLQDETLVIVGKGSHRDDLKRKAKENIIFLQDISDNRLADLYEKAEALIMPQEEDFGYVALEAQYFWCPVITYSKSGAAESVINYETGIYFDTQSYEGLQKAIAIFKEKKHSIKKNLQMKSHQYLKMFTKQTFLEKFSNIV